MEPNKDRKTFILVSLFVAFISGLCVIIAAVIEISPQVKPDLFSKITAQEVEKLSETEIPVLESTTAPVTENLPTSEEFAFRIQENLLTNSGFENIDNIGFPVDWSYDYFHKSGLSLSEGYDGLGFCSLQTLKSNEGKRWVGFGQDIPAVGDTNYSVSGWFYLENAVGFHIHVEWYDASGNYLGWAQFTETIGNSQEPKSTHGWIFLQGQSTSPTNTDILRLGIWHGVANDMINVEGSYICADNVELGLTH